MHHAIGRIARRLLNQEEGRSVRSVEGVTVREVSEFKPRGAHAFSESQ